MARELQGKRHNTDRNGKEHVVEPAASGHHHLGFVRLIFICIMSYRVMQVSTRQILQEFLTVAIFLSDQLRQSRTEIIPQTSCRYPLALFLCKRTDPLPPHDAVMAGSRCRVDGFCLGDGSGSGLGRLGGLCLGLCLGLVLLTLQGGHVVVILVVVLFLLILAAQSGTAAELGKVDATEVAACA